MLPDRLLALGLRYLTWEWHRLRRANDHILKRIDRLSDELLRRNYDRNQRRRNRR